MDGQSIFIMFVDLFFYISNIDLFGSFDHEITCTKQIQRFLSSVAFTIGLVSNLINDKHVHDLTTDLRTEIQNKYHGLLNG